MTPLKEISVNKSERLNDMIRYLNNRDHFNLSHLMEKYNISKSTALRDIASLEALGMPIYSSSGRYGRYGLLKNRLMSPILFTIDEVYALYFAMLTLNGYQSTPFHLSILQLNEKFERCLSPQQLDRVHQMRKVLQLEGNPHYHTSAFLNEILQSILDEQTCTIQYVKEGREQVYQVQFFNISAKFGQWYANGIVIEDQAFKVFRCDKITAVHRSDAASPYSIEELNRLSLDIYQGEQAVQFEVEIADQAKDLFYKESYPSMQLETGERTLIKGFYPLEDEPFIAKYFVQYGLLIRSVQPASLKQAMERHTSALLQHLQLLT
jgi:predicted DNA-binding transcriptional regulator YafY